MTPSRSLKRVALPLTALSLLAAAGCSLGTSDGAPEEAESASAAVANCPRTNPLYPDCTEPKEDLCATATGTLTANPPSIPLGQSTHIAWTTNIPAGCTKALTFDGDAVSPTGYKVEAPINNSGYGLRLGTRLLKSVQVSVVLPSTVYINGSTIDWKRLLVQALGTPNTRIVLKSDVDMDMAGFSNIPVAHGVTLTSEAPAPILTTSPGSLFKQESLLATGASLLPINTPRPIYVPSPGPARNAHSLGPRLFTNDLPKPLFRIACGSDAPTGNVHFSAFRIQGPHLDSMSGDDNLERGIEIDSCNGVEISNMEVSGFSGQAIYMEDPNNTQNLLADAVFIHDSYLHNNQHAEGNGQAIEVGPGAFARIERNVFDNNRQAIMSLGNLGTSFTADSNLVLFGGGHHDSTFHKYTEMFDMEADDSGNAGDFFSITNNAFQYKNEVAIRTHGTPRKGATITGNVSARKDGYDLDSSTNVTFSDNREDDNLGTTDTYGEYGVGDFDGDGKDDLFLATGTSWWYSNGAKMPWAFLKHASELLHQVGLGDFDGDGRCDVVAVNTSTSNLEISRSGTAPWAALPGVTSVSFDQLAFGDFDGDKIMDVFHRASDGQWSFIAPGRSGWTPLTRSDQPFYGLRLGDFDGDGITDVLGINDHKWAVSLGGRSAWQPFSGVPETLSADQGSMLIANVDGVPGDEVIRSYSTGSTSIDWATANISHTFQAFTSLDTPAIQCTDTKDKCVGTLSVVGRFDDVPGADLLFLDVYRRSSVFNRSSGAFTPHGYFFY